MSFYAKLKARLIGSSSKLGAGLAAIVAGGGDAASHTAPRIAPDGNGPNGPEMRAKTLAGGSLRRVLDDAMLQQLEDLLVQADMGVETASRVTANVARGRLGKQFSVLELKDALAVEIARIMESVARPLPLFRAI